MHSVEGEKAGAGISDFNISAQYFCPVLFLPNVMPSILPADYVFDTRSSFSAIHLPLFLLLHLD